LRRLLRLPPEALAKIWQVLGPSLADTIPQDAEQLLDVFCVAYHLDEDDLARALKACRFILREAARIDLPVAQLADDLDRVCPDDPFIKEILIAGYDPARAQIRRDILHAALIDHGNLLIGAKWRLDTVQATEQGSNLRTPVALLTLQYRDGPDTKRLTLHVLPDMMGQLKEICEQVLT
jgi:hypothetical protein